MSNVSSVPQIPFEGQTRTGEPFLIWHVCTICQQPRSARYHQQHPVSEGDGVPTQVPCGRCVTRLNLPPPPPSPEPLLILADAVSEAQSAGRESEHQFIPPPPPPRAPSPPSPIPIRVSRHERDCEFETHRSVNSHGNYREAERRLNSHPQPFSYGPSIRHEEAPPYHAPPPEPQYHASAPPSMRQSRPEAVQSPPARPSLPQYMRQSMRPPRPAAMNGPPPRPSPPGYMRHSTPSEAAYSAPRRPSPPDFQSSDPDYYIYRRDVTSRWPRDEAYYATIFETPHPVADHAPRRPAPPAQAPAPSPRVPAPLKRRVSFASEDDVATLPPDLPSSQGDTFLAGLSRMRLDPHSLDEARNPQPDHEFERLRGLKFVDEVDRPYTPERPLSRALSESPAREGPLAKDKVDNEAEDGFSLGHGPYKAEISPTASMEVLAESELGDKEDQNYSAPQRQPLRGRHDVLQSRLTHASDKPIPPRRQPRQSVHAPDRRSPRHSVRGRHDFRRSEPPHREFRQQPDPRDDFRPSRPSRSPRHRPREADEEEEDDEREWTRYVTVREYRDAIGPCVEVEEKLVYDDPKP